MSATGAGQSDMTYHVELILGQVNQTDMTHHVGLILGQVNYLYTTYNVGLQLGQVNQSDMTYHVESVLSQVKQSWQEVTATSARQQPLNMSIVFILPVNSRMYRGNRHGRTTKIVRPRPSTDLASEEIN